MTAEQVLPTSYADFFARAFAKSRQSVREPAYVFGAAAVVDAVDECHCTTAVINLTAFVEGIGEHYVLTDEQKEHLEEALTESGLEVSDEGTCAEHSEDDD
jgi:hypothetical protein